MNVKVDHQRFLEQIDISRPSFADVARVSALFATKDARPVRGWIGFLD
jgi:hypothetical protein